MLRKNYYGILVGMITLLLFMGASCTPTNDTNNEPSDTEPEITTSADANVPEGCVGENTLVIESDEAGKETPKAVNSYAIQWDGSEDDLQLVFADYDVDPDSIYSEITDDRMLAVVYLGYTDNEDPIATGVYTTAVDSLMQISELNISTAELAGGVFDDMAEVEITYIGDDYVCGSITADDDYSSMNGEFIAQYMLNSI